MAAPEKKVKAAKAEKKDKEKKHKTKDKDKDKQNAGKGGKRQRWKSECELDDCGMPGEQLEKQLRLAFVRIQCQM